jgi:hypothetical protein
MGCMAGVRFSAGARDILLPHSAQTYCGVHPAFYPMSTKGFFHGVKPPGMKLLIHLDLVRKSGMMGICLFIRLHVVEFKEVSTATTSPFIFTKYISSFD